MERFQVIDADGHVEESAASLQKYLKQGNRGRPLWTSDAWDRDFGKTWANPTKIPTFNSQTWTSTGSMSK